MNNYQKPSYTSFRRRFAAFCIDSVLAMLLISPIIHFTIQLASGQTLTAKTLLIYSMIELVFVAAICIIFWLTRSATPGKIFVKAIIRDANTLDKPTTRQLIIRYLGYYVSILSLGLGFLWIIWDNRKQSFHDKMANTVVIQLDPKTKF